MQYIVLDSGDITQMQKWILMHLNISVEIIGPKDVPDIRATLKKYTHLLQYFDYGWSGRKFFIPLLRKNIHRFILLDVDILTYRVPLQVRDWLYSRSNRNLFMQDYKNFSVLSHIEMKHILKKQLHHTNVNTGFLCIHRDGVFKKISLKTLNTFVKSLHETTTDRMIQDLKTSNPVDYVYPMIEQTLYWYIFEHTKSTALPATEYVIFPRHAQTHGEICNPVMIHFSGESDKESEYKYIWMSLQSHPKDHTIPWYMQSQVYCMICRSKKMI